MNSPSHLIQRTRWAQHVFFWLSSYTVLLFHFSINKPPGAVDYVYTALYHIPLIAGIYLHLNWGLPNLLRSKKYPLLLIWLGLVLGIMIILHEFTFSYISSWFFPGFYLLSFVDYAHLSLYFSIYLILGTLLHLSKSWFFLLESERRLAQIHKEKFQTELKALKGQIHPHFLFNSLNNLYALSLKNSTELPNMILKLSDLLRYMIYEVEDDYIPLQKEVEHLQSYIALQKIRLNENQQVDFQVNGPINDQKIAPLIFINFIENAFKHGMTTHDKSSEIDIKIFTHNEQVVLDVRNSKPHEHGPIKREVSTGIGLENVRRRLEMRYPGTYELQIREDDFQFWVHLSLTLQP
ncbi:MAG: histidine kinase [Bacteroidota bacterium]